MGLTKKNAEAFDRAVIDIATGLGAVLHEERSKLLGSEVVAIQTKAGRMTIRPSTRPVKGKQEALFAVYCKFEDVERANKLGLGQILNTYSGKYNFNFSGHDAHVVSALQSFRQHLEACGTMTTGTTPPD